MCVACGILVCLYDTLFGVICFVIGYCGICLLWVLIVGCLLCGFVSCGLYGCVGFGARFAGGGSWLR